MHTRKGARPRLRLVVGFMVAVAAIGLTSHAGAVSPDVVISQVYGGGGNSGATLKNDFIELFNRGTSPVDVSGWSVQYASSAGSTWQRTNLTGVIQPGHYYLIQEAQGAGGTVDLPTPDATGAIPMSGTSGKVALVTNQTLLTCGATPGNCFPNTDIRDFVGYGGSANNFEGTGPTPTLSNTTAALRSADGCVDTDDNASDFATGAPNPRNSAAPPKTNCDEPPPPDPDPVPIYEIQGTGDTSPVNGTEQATTGIVTVVVSNGFFMQDGAGDGDPATSDGIFVFTGSSLARTVAPGDTVEVIGTVQEFRSSSRPRDLPLTEFSSVSDLEITGTAAVPAPTTISDRPDEVISPDGIQTFERLEGMRVSVAAPTVTGATNSFGEFVVVASGDSSNTTANGNIIVRDLPGDAVDYNPERIMIDDEAREPGGSGSGTRINSPQVQVKVGDDATGDIVGALDYQFSNYRVQAANELSDVLPANTAPTDGANLRDPEPYEGRLATFNVENLFDCVDAPGKDDRASCSASALADLEDQLTKLAKAFQEELESPELTIIEETENTEVLTGDADGQIPGTDVPALLPRLQGNWDAVSFDASDVRGIEVGFIFNTDRVMLHDAYLSTDVLPDSEGVFNGTSFRAGREPLVGHFTLDDIDLIVVGNHFKSKGGPQFGVEPGDPEGNEAGDDPLYGTQQPPIRFTERIRHKQADYVRRLVDQLLAGNPGANLAVGGDLNDFPFAEPNEGTDTVARVKQSPTDPLTNVIDRLPEDARYTFIFEGNSQVLDHILINSALEARLEHQDIAHFNTDFPDSFGEDSTIALRSSDHDPLVSYYCTDATVPTLDVSATPSVLQPPNHKYRRVDATVTLEDDRDSAPMVELVSVTSNEPDDAPGGSDGNTRNDIVVVDDDTFLLRAERDERGQGRVYTITYRATDACGNATEDTARVLVPVR
jgi:uncharacterized protein